jgi:hypothetical protein
VVLWQTRQHQGAADQAVEALLEARPAALGQQIKVTKAATLLQPGRTSLILLSTAVAEVLLKKATLTVTLKVATV